jgi:hypothetical protein
MNWVELLILALVIAVGAPIWASLIIPIRQPPKKKESGCAEDSILLITEGRVRIAHGRLFIEYQHLGHVRWDSIPPGDSLTFSLDDRGARYNLLIKFCEDKTVQFSAEREIRERDDEP